MEIYDLSFLLLRGAIKNVVLGFGALWTFLGGVSLERYKKNKKNASDFLKKKGKLSVLYLRKFSVDPH